MKTLLIINSSPSQNDSVSRELAEKYQQLWRQQNPSGEVIQRDLANTPLTPLDSQTIAAFYTAPEQHTDATKEQLALSDTLVAELQRADDVVIAAPMHNFSVPGSLKLWIDLICRVGVTFRYGSAGPEGLLLGKTATLLLSRGGRYADGTAMAAFNHQDPMLTTVLNFVGITEIKTIIAEGNSGNHSTIEQARNEVAAAFI